MDNESEIQAAELARMPLMPAIPSKTVDGREITQELIDAVLAYDKTKRPAILKLNEKDAHSNENGPSLATFDRTFIDGELIYAEFTPSDGNGELLRRIAGINGPYPGRSIEVDKLLIDGKKQLWLEAVALCGAQKAAIQNLPPVEFSAGGSKINFTVSLIGDEAMETTVTKPDETKVDLAKIKSELEADFAKKEATLREDFAKEQSKLQSQLDKKELEQKFLNDFRRKVRADERDGLINLALSLKPSEAKITFGKEEKSQYDAFLASLSARPDILPDTKQIAGGLPNQMEGKEVEEDPEKMKMAAIKKAGEELKLDLNTADGYAKAMTAAHRKDPAIFEGVR